MRREFPHISGGGKDPVDPNDILHRTRQPHPRLDESSKLRAEWLSKVRTPEGTLSEEFKEWFGNSIITVDGIPGGEPAVLYHYYLRKELSYDTENKTFDPEKTELGLHFGTAQAASNRSFVIGGSETLTIPAVIKMESPLYMSDIGNFKLNERHDMRPEILYRVIEDKQHYGLPIPSEDALTNIKTMRELQGWLKGQGYDGVVYRNLKEEQGRSGPVDSVIVFDPITQVRSALTGEPVYDKDGTFLL